MTITKFNKRANNFVVLKDSQQTSASRKSNSGAHVYSEVSKFLKLKNLERKMLVMCAWNGIKRILLQEKGQAAGY